MEPTIYVARSTSDQLKIESVCDQVAWIQGYTQRSFRQRLDQPSNMRNRFGTGFASEEGAVMLRVPSEVAQYIAQQFMSRILDRFGDQPNLVDDNCGPKIAGHLHGFFGCRHAAIEIFHAVVAATRLESDRYNPQIQITQQLSNLPKGGPRDFGWTKIGAGVDLNRVDA